MASRFPSAPSFKPAIKTRSMAGKNRGLIFRWIFLTAGLVDIATTLERRLVGPAMVRDPQVHLAALAELACRANCLHEEEAPGAEKLNRIYKERERFHRADQEPSYIADDRNDPVESLRAARSANQRSPAKKEEKAFAWLPSQRTMSDRVSGGCFRYVAVPGSRGLLKKELAPRPGAAT